MRICHFLAPEGTPLDLLTADPTQLPAELAAAIGDKLALDETLGILYRYSLVTRDRPGLRMHRLVQTALRTDLDDEQAAEEAARAVRLVRAAFPDQPWLPSTWPRCGTLLPHALTATSNATEHQVGLDAAAELLRYVGVYLWHRAEFHAARQHLGQAIAIATTVYGPNHPKVGILLCNLGIVLTDLDLNAARKVSERALAIFEAAVEPNHLHLAKALTTLGEVLRRLGELPAARTHLERALATLERAVGPDDPHISTALCALGAVLHDLGDLAEARAQLERGVALGESASGPDDPEVADNLIDLGAVLRDLGEVTEAQARLERALAILKATLGENHPATQRAQQVLRSLHG
jgi:tetratricopeptide (TPR) repeat protein